MHCLAWAHNVLLGRVQSNLKLAEPQQQRCPVKKRAILTRQFSHRWQQNNKIYVERIFCNVLLYLRWNFSFESPISLAKYLAGCQKHGTVLCCGEKVLSNIITPVFGYKLQHTEMSTPWHKNLQHIEMSTPWHKKTKLNIAKHTVTSAQEELTVEDPI